MLLRVTPAKPRSRAMASRSKGKPLPASAPEPSGRTIGAAAGFAEALPIAREHFEVGQQIVRPEHRLRAAHVRVAGDHGVGILRRQIEQRLHHAARAARARGRIPRAARGAYRATPARCGCGRCGSCRPPRRRAPSACG